MWTSFIRSIWKMTDRKFHLDRTYRSEDIARKRHGQDIIPKMTVDNYCFHRALEKCCLAFQIFPTAILFISLNTICPFNGKKHSLFYPPSVSEMVDLSEQLVSFARDGWFFSLIYYVKHPTPICIKVFACFKIDYNLSLLLLHLTRVPSWINRVFGRKLLYALCAMLCEHTEKVCRLFPAWLC